MTSPPAETPPPGGRMASPTLWLVAAALGAGQAVLAGVVGFAFGVLFFVLALPLGRGGRLILVASGLLTGFGLAWLVLLASQGLSGGRLDNAGVWLAVGLVPLGLGLLLGLGGAALARR